MVEEPVLVLDAVSGETLRGAQSVARVAHAALCARRDAGDVGAVDLPADRTSLPEIEAAAARFRSRFDRLLILGDDAAARAAVVPAACFAPRPGGLAVVDATGPEPAGFDALLADRSLLRTSFVLVGRFGEDGPAARRYREIRERLRTRFSGGWREHVAIVTDPANGPLRGEAARTGVAAFPLHENVPGALGVLGPAGLFPAACAGIDPVALLDGARSARDRFDEAGDGSDPACRLATVLGPAGPDPVAGCPELRAAAAWFRGLWPVSDGEPVRVRLSVAGDEEAGIGPGVAVRISGRGEGAIGALLQTLVLAAVMEVGR